MALAWVTQEAAGQTEEEERPRVVAKRGTGDLFGDVSEQHLAGGEVATEGGGDAPREVREHPLLRVVVVGGLGDPGCTLADTGHVVEPEAGQGKLGECPRAVLTVEPLSGGGEKLDGVWHRTGVLLEHPEREQGPARALRGGLDPSSTRATSDLVRSASPARKASAAAVAIQSAVSAASPTSSAARSIAADAAAYPCRVRLWSAARTRSCASCCVRAGGGFGSVPGPRERGWIGGENIRQRAMGRPLLRRSRHGQHRRAQQRMAEADLRAVTHQHVVVLGLVQCGSNVHSLPDQRRSHRCGGPRAVERGQQYGAPGRCGQAGELLLVHDPKTVAHGQRVGQRRGTHSLGIGEAAGDLQDPERVAARVVDQALDDSIRNAIRHQVQGRRRGTGQRVSGRAFPARTPVRSSRFVPPTQSTLGPRGGDEPRTRVQLPTPGRPTAGRRPAQAPVPVLTPRRAGTAPPRQPESARKEPPLVPTREPRTVRWPARRVSRPADPESGRAPAAALREPGPIRTRRPAPTDTGSRWPSARRPPAGLSSRCRAHPPPPAWSSPPRESPRAAHALARVRGRDRRSRSPRWGISPTRTTAARCDRAREASRLKEVPMRTLAKILRTIGRWLTWPDWAVRRTTAPRAVAHHFYYRYPSRSDERR